jgi:hypothetical protein
VVYTVFFFGTDAMRVPSALEYLSQLGNGEEGSTRFSFGAEGHGCFVCF